MNRPFVNRLNDFVFKRIFGSESNKDILLNFLNSILKNSELITLELLDREIDPEYISDKYARLDILAKTVKGTLINIELQVRNHFNIEKRTLFYWAKLYQNQLKASEGHETLKKTITINIVNFSCLPNNNRYHNIFHLREGETGHILLDDIEIHFLELPKMRRLKLSQPTKLEKWLMYLNNVSGEEMEDIAMSEPMIQKAISCEEILIKNDRERRLYELREKAVAEEITLIQGAKAEGRIEGRIEGRLEGRAEIVRSLLMNGMSVEQIKEVTNLSEEEILDFKNNLN
jgi:predicted transposase/invertase (TIGR01784 family)